MGEQFERIDKSIGPAAGLDDQHHAAGRICRGNGFDAEPGGRITPPRQRVNADNVSATALEKQARQNPDGTESEHHDLGAEDGPGIEGDLQGGLDEWKKSRLPQVDLCRQGHELVTSGDEPVLVWVEREKHSAVGLPDTCIAVSERVGKRSAERSYLLVRLYTRVEFASVGEHFGP